MSERTSPRSLLKLKKFYKKILYDSPEWHTEVAYNSYNESCAGRHVIEVSLGERWLIENVFLLEFLCCYDLGMSLLMCYFSEKLLLCELLSKWITHIDFTERGLPVRKCGGKNILKPAIIPPVGLELEEPSSD